MLGGSTGATKLKKFSFYLDLTHLKLKMYIYKDRIGKEPNP